MKSIASMLLGLLLSVFIGSNRVIAATLTTLQSEGSAIYDLSQAITSLVTLDGETSRMSVKVHLKLSCSCSWRTHRFDVGPLNLRTIIVSKLDGCFHFTTPNPPMHHPLNWYVTVTRYIQLLCVYRISAYRILCSLLLASYYCIEARNGATLIDHV